MSHGLPPERADAAGPKAAAELGPALERALDARAALILALRAEDTDCYRLFHGSAEGAPGVTVDRYGDVLLVQSFHAPMAEDALATIRAFYRQAHPVFEHVVYNDRSGPGSRILNALGAEEQAIAEAQRIVRELGVAYLFRARHRGQDPWLFLDLRAARRHVKRIAKGKTVLNLFAYTCGVGTCAAVGGAARVLNVDFATSSMDVGRANAALNGVEDRVAFLQGDFFPVARQLAGLGMPKRRGGAPSAPPPRIEPESFDVVFLDPPARAQSPYGVVDLVNDYGAVLKPALLATREGGELICCNNVARVDAAPWLESLARAVRKHGRTLRHAEMLRPEADFPSRDDRPPLKIALLSV